MEPPKRRMYLFDWNAKNSTLIVSLGGNVTHDEVLAFGEDLLTTIDMVGGVHNLVIDSARAHFSDGRACLGLSLVKDQCLCGPVDRIVSVVADRNQEEEVVAQRLQSVLEGRESVRHDFPAALLPAQTRKAAA